MQLPQAFVWSKMGAESGEGLARIIRRKEFERALGDGMFAWGIGSSLGSAALEALRQREANPIAIFSPMPSKAKAVDEAPSSVLLWSEYEDAFGKICQLPDHMLVTSRGTAGANAKTRHYALFCHTRLPVALAEGLGVVEPAWLRNILGNPLGASQVTAVVKRVAVPAGSGRQYPIAFSADLVGDMCVRLAGPRLLTPEDAAQITIAADAGLEAWAALVQRLRRASVRASIAQAAATPNPLPRQRPLF